MSLLFALHTPLDPLHGDGYQFWSGIAGCLGIFTAAYTLWRRHSCHTPRCWRLGRFPVDGTRFVVCSKCHEQVTGEPGAVHIDHMRWHWRRNPTRRF